jgi:hypothetical protein
MQVRHHGYLGSEPFTPEVTPLLSALFLISSTVVTTLLELFGLEEEEEGSDLLVYGSRPLYIGRGLVTG